MLLIEFLSDSDSKRRVAKGDYYFTNTVCPSLRWMHLTNGNVVSGVVSDFPQKELRAPNVAQVKNWTKMNLSPKLGAIIDTDNVTRNCGY